MTLLSKAQRALYESDRAAFYASLPPRKARKAIPRSSTTKPRKAIRHKPRDPEETLRIHGVPEFRAWIKTLACKGCGLVGFSEAAHVTNDGTKGTSRKAGWRCTTPLCNARGNNCHRRFDRWLAPFDSLVTRAPIMATAAITAKAWDAEAARLGLIL